MASSNCGFVELGQQTCPVTEDEPSVAATLTGGAAPGSVARRLGPDRQDLLRQDRQDRPAAHQRPPASQWRPQGGGGGREGVGGELSAASHPPSACEGRRWGGVGVGGWDGVATRRMLMRCCCSCCCCCCCCCCCSMPSKGATEGSAGGQGLLVAATAAPTARQEDHRRGVPEEFTIDPQHTHPTPPSLPPPSPPKRTHLSLPPARPNRLVGSTARGHCARCLHVAATLALAAATHPTAAAVHRHQVCDGLALLQVVGPTILRLLALRRPRESRHLRGLLAVRLGSEAPLLGLLGLRRLRGSTAVPLGLHRCCLVQPGGLLPLSHWAVLLGRASTVPLRPRGASAAIATTSGAC